MRSRDVRDELQDGVDSAPLPPMGQDGGPALEPAAPIQDPPPRLCEAGPCRHYHRFAVQLDAANPMAERRDGKLIHHARVFHVTTNHYCYPDVGIETNLGSLPVLECNRWVPIKGLLRMRRTVLGEYQRDLAAWHDAREREADELAATIGSGPVDVVVKIVLLAGETYSPVMVNRVPADGDSTLSAVAALSLAQLPEPIAAAVDSFAVEVEGSPVTNLEATVGQLEIGPDTQVVIVIKNKEIA